MKNNFFLLVIILVVACGNVTPANAEYCSDNTRYQMLHIKQMAKRNFTDRGRAKYVYIEKKSTNDVATKSELGTTYLNGKNKVRELHIGIDLQNGSRLKRKAGTGGKKLSIGKVKGGGRSLKKINLIIDSNRALKFK